MYRVKVKHIRDFEFKVQSSGREFIVDAKSGPGPLEVLLSGLASCMGVYIRKYAEGSKLDLSNFDIIAEAGLSKESPFSFRNINVTVNLASSQLDERRKNALARFLKNCPVHNTLKGNPEIQVQIKLGHGNQSQAEG